MQSYGSDFTVAIEEELTRVVYDECGSVIDRKGCGTCVKLVERISGSSEISGVRLQDRQAGINSI